MIKISSRKGCTQQYICQNGTFTMNNIVKGSTTKQDFLYTGTAEMKRSQVDFKLIEHYLECRTDFGDEQVCKKLKKMINKSGYSINYFS